jgi:hypothetical protein
MMNKIGVSDSGNVRQQPIGYFDVDQRDADIDLLYRKVCPFHSTPLTLKKEIRLGGGDNRLRYGCRSCRCYVDFKGNEMKPGSIGWAIEIVNDMRMEERELTAAKGKPTEEIGIEI